MTAGIEIERGVPAETIVRYEPRGAALEMMRAREKELLICGQAGTGKTLAVLFKLHLTALALPRARFLLVRDTHVALTETTLVTFERDVIAEALAGGIVNWFGGSSRQPPAYRYSNGARLVVGGLDRPAKFLGGEYDRIVVDEGTEATKDAVEILISRLRGTAKTYKQIVIACNPSYPSHWLKQRADDPGSGMRMLTSRHRDNPAFVNADGTYTARGAEYMTMLDSLTGVRRLRYKEGIWAAAEGVVYEGWDDALHIVERFEPPPSWPRIWAVDFGLVHPFVWQEWVVDPDGRMFLYREIYMTGRLVEDHATQIRALHGLGPIEKRGNSWVTQPYTGPERSPGERAMPRAVVTDHDAEDRATFERYAGIGTVPANKNVSEGINAVASRLKPQVDGKPRLMIMKGACVERDRTLAAKGHPTNTAEEIPGYIWADHKTKDQPVKERDDGADCARYATAEQDLHGVTRVRWG